METQVTSFDTEGQAATSRNRKCQEVECDRALMCLDARARQRVTDRAALYRRCDPLFADWACELPAIEHSDLTQVRVYELAELLVKWGIVPGVSWVFEKMIAADRFASSAMWLVVHMTHAKRVNLGGRPLGSADFKETPEGHSDGSLNMVPAYVGYLAANLLSATTRSWVMRQGHCVAAIEAVNAIVGNRTPEQAELAAVSGLGDPRVFA